MLPGVRGSLKAACFHSKSRGSSQLVRNHCEIKHMCFRGGRGSLKAGSFHSKTRGSSHMVRNPKNSAICALRAAGDRAWTGCSVPGRCCRSLTLTKNPDPFLRSLLTKRGRGILFETRASTRSRGPLLKKLGAPERAVCAFVLPRCIV